jgi:uncharacterized protein (DUF433 family)
VGFAVIRILFCYCHYLKISQVFEIFDFLVSACYYAHAMQYKYLESRPDRASGELTIKGTRIRIAQVINMLANGHTLAQMYDGWPWLSAATLKGAIEEAAALLSDQNSQTHAEAIL